jgi:N-alpha-acetyltransferase 35, NatC auxiliary subunit
MDSRMDSGLVNEGDEHIPFDPLTTLLPEEVCWILDMAMACEVGILFIAAFQTT